MLIKSLMVYYESDFVCKRYFLYDLNFNDIHLHFDYWISNAAKSVNNIEICTSKYIFCFYTEKMKTTVHQMRNESNKK